jgi:hypothetical protein
VQVTDPSTEGPSVRYVADDSWSEETITYANQPAADVTNKLPLDDVGASSLNQMVEYDVTLAASRYVRTPAMYRTGLFHTVSRRLVFSEVLTRR